MAIAESRTFLFMGVTTGEESVASIFCLSIRRVQYLSVGHIHSFCPSVASIVYHVHCLFICFSVRLLRPSSVCLSVRPCRIHSCLSVRGRGVDRLSRPLSVTSNLSVHLFFHPSIASIVRLFVGPSVCPWSVCPSHPLFVCLSVASIYCLSVFPSVRPSVRLAHCLFVCSSV